MAVATAESTGGLPSCEIVRARSTSHALGIAAPTTARVAGRYPASRSRCEQVSGTAASVRAFSCIAIRAETSLRAIDGHVQNHRTWLHIPSIQRIPALSSCESTKKVQSPRGRDCTFVQVFGTLAIQITFSQPRPRGIRDGLSPILEMEPLQNLPHVILDRAFAETERRAHFFVL